MAKFAWKEHFKEQLQGLESFYQSSPRTEGILSFAIAQDLLKEEAYLEWAQAHYSMVRLKGSYFTDMTPHPELWSHYRENFTWSPEIIPVTEWDGHLVIATLDPEFQSLADLQKFKQPPIFVLADTQSLRKWFDKYQESAPALKSSSNEEALITDLDLKDDSIEHISAEEVAELEENSPEGFEGHLELEALERPEGISINEEPIKMTLDFASLRAPKSDEAPAESASASNSVVAAQAPLEEKAPANPHSEIKEALKAPPPPPPPVSINTQLSNIRPLAQVKSATEGQSTVGYSLDGWKEDFLKLEASKAFEKMKSHFDKSLLLSVSSDESKMKVQFWDSSFKKPEQDQTIQLKTPSIFNIVTQTVKPFHGPISLNEINEQFFEIWNQSQIPSHVTITPIVVQDRLVAMLMGFGSSQAFNKSTLSYAEKISSEISGDLSASISAA